MQQKVSTILFGLAGLPTVADAQDEILGKGFLKSDRSSDTKLCYTFTNTYVETR
jgi:hypothetical protein